MRNSARGLTLIELLVVLAIAAVLTAFAVPGYRHHVERAQRTEARSALLSLAAAQERHYLQCQRYASSLSATLPSDCALQRLRFAPVSERGYYTIAMDAADAAGWSARATRAAGTAQSGDSRCRTLTLDSEGTKAAVDDAGVTRTGECWDR